MTTRVLVAAGASMLLAVQIAAQTPSVVVTEAPVVALAPPSLDLVDKEALGLEADTSRAIQATCDALDTTQRWRRLRNVLDAQLRAKYPGFRLNWATRALEPLKAAAQ